MLSAAYVYELCTNESSILLGHIKRVHRMRRKGSVFPFATHTAHAPKLRVPKWMLSRSYRMDGPFNVWKNIINMHIRRSYLCGYFVTIMFYVWYGPHSTVHMGNGYGSHELLLCNILWIHLWMERKNLMYVSIEKQNNNENSIANSWNAFFLSCSLGSPEPFIQFKPIHSRFVIRRRRETVCCCEIKNKYLLGTTIFAPSRGFFCSFFY